MELHLMGSLLFQNMTKKRVSRSFSHAKVDQSAVSYTDFKGQFNKIACSHLIYALLNIHLASRVLYCVYCSCFLFIIAVN